MERTINFIQVVYEYYKNEPPYSDFTLEELLEKEIPTGKKAASVPVAEFEQARQDFTKDFRDIVRIFCIEDFIEDFKINGEYQFTFADRDFLVTLVNHYRTKQAWIKALKKAFNYPLDKRNFENLNREYFCKFQHSGELIAELRFAVEGFLEMYNRLETISKDAKKKFEQTIQIATQYPIMAFKQFFSNRIFDMCTSAITLEDVTHSLDGVILNDYYQWLHTTASQLDSVISNAQDSLIAIRKERAKEFQNAMNKEAELRIVSECAERLNQYVREHCPEALDEHDEWEDSSMKRTLAESKKQRTKNSRHRQVWKDALMNEQKNHPEAFEIMAKFYNII